MSEGLYGKPPRALATAARDAGQFSPFALDGAAIEDLGDGALSAFTVLAPAGTLERRYVLAHALRALAPGGRLVAMAPKTKGGARLRAELNAFGCEVNEAAKAHHRICHCARPEYPVGIAEAIAIGAPQIPPGLGLWSQPGLFSWDRLDPGSALLARTGEPFSGVGADIGCGYGALALAVLERAGVRDLLLIDTDRRAVDAARRNVTDARARFLHADGRFALQGSDKLDFVVINPPFHSGGAEDRGLGQDLVVAGARALRRGGICRLVANVALPYEAVLAAECSSVKLLVREGGFKIIEGRR